MVLKRLIATQRNGTQRTLRNPKRTYAKDLRNATQGAHFVQDEVVEKMSARQRKLLCLLLLRKIRRRRRRRHRFWIGLRDIFQLRKQKGEFNLFCEMLWSRSWINSITTSGWVPPCFKKGRTYDRKITQTSVTDQRTRASCWLYQVGLKVNSECVGHGYY